MEEVGGLGNGDGGEGCGLWLRISDRGISLGTWGRDWGS